jgi:hypothetical protein
MFTNIPKILSFSPDCSGNPLLFFFKKAKIATKSGKMDCKNAQAIRFKLF